MKHSLSVAITITGVFISACGSNGGGTPANTMQGSGGAGTPMLGATGGSTAGPPNSPATSGPKTGTGGNGPGGMIGSGGHGGAGGAGAARASSDAGATDSGAGAGGAGDAGGAAGACDRSCLLNVLQSYLDALIMHDPTKAAISPQVKMTDNGVVAMPGDGLWKTASMLVTDERLDYADPVTHNVGSQCVINEGNTPALYEVRLKVDAGQITEIESMTVRSADAANGFFDPSNLKPQPVFLQMPDPTKRMSRDELMAMQETYLDYLEGKKAGSDVAFDTNCARYENGVATATGVSSFNLQSWSFSVTRRVLIIDEEAGITWGMFPFMQDDTALVVGEAFKMLDGKIMMIQAVMAYMPSKAWN